METENLCLECGKPINLEDYEESLSIPQLMKKNRICFKCAFWFKRYEEDMKINDMEGVVMITPNYEHYILHPKAVMINMGSFSSIIFTATNMYVAIYREGKPYVYVQAFNNWSYQGNIPESYRKLFTPNGIFITPEQMKDFMNRKSFTPEDLKNYMIKSLENHE